MYYETNISFIMKSVFRRLVYSLRAVLMNNFLIIFFQTCDDRIKSPHKKGFVF